MQTTSNRHKILIANPGAGKTERLSEEVVKLIGLGVRPEKILCVTFTVKARTEMEDRISKKMSEKNYAGSLPDIETFHSYCIGLLRQFDMNPDIISERLARYFITKSILSRDVTTGTEESLYREVNSYILTTGKVINAIKLIKSFGILPDEVSDSESLSILSEMYENQEGSVKISLEEAKALLDKFLLVFRDYETYKKNRLLDYQDILILARDILKKMKSPPYDHILVDEVQDISALESQIIKLSGKNIFAVGDSKQAIFGFQGGNVESFNAFRNHRDFEKEIMMHTFRLPGNVVDYVISFFSRLNIEQDISELQVMESMKEGIEGEVRITLSDNPEETAALAVRNILKAISKDERIGIIVRSNYQALKVSEFMKNMQIDHGSGSIVTTLETEKRVITTFIMGILSTEKNDVIKALYTEYSGVSLRDAIKTVDIIQFKNEFDEYLPEPFSSMRRKYSENMGMLQKLFTEYIIPKSIEKGGNFFLAAKELSNAIPEFFEKVNGGKQDLISFLKQENSDESVEDEIEKRITISTVHKSKGREFDHVIYVPSRKSWGDPSGMDLVMNSILRTKDQHYDPDDRKEEENRIDFVALTRTRKSLWILTKSKESDRYKIDGKCILTKLDSESPEFETISRKKISEKDSASPMENLDRWLMEFIQKKINRLKRLSFSMIGSLDELPSFVSRYILAISDFSTALQLGTNTHKIIEDFLTNNEIPGLLNSDLETKSWNNFLKYYADVNSLTGVKWILSEGTVQCNVMDLFPDIKTDLTIMGKIDAGYTFMQDGIEKTRIVDFKTSKEAGDLDKYYEQISLYSYLYSLQNHIPIQNIEGEVVMLSVREGKISTGKVDLKVYQANSLMIERAIEAVKKRIQMFVNIQNNPEMLYEMILKAKEKYTPSEIFKQVQREISLELKGVA